MKYLKRFEKEDNYFKYKEGDYVVIDIDKIKNHNKETQYNKNPINDNVIISDYISDSSLYYETIDAYGNVYGVYQPEIIREMTIDEINNFILIKNSNKFNI